MRTPGGRLRPNDKDGDRPVRNQAGTTIEEAKKNNTVDGWVALARAQREAPGNEMKRFGCESNTEEKKYKLTNPNPD